MDENTLERIDGLDMADRGRNGTSALKYVQLDPATFRDDRPVKFLQSLRGHPLLALPSLVELARRRPKIRVRIYNSETVTAGDRLEGVAEKHGGDRTFVEMVGDIEQNNTYLFIQNVETDPIYGPFVRELL